ncbi:hypothetical protein HPB50_023308 [Hyalomma asiaticum]|uniref:Uncharacterized protein n=1 Tax=Hyalomma asiaticum TaxID=266040 RepID=A0ACB7TL12_HYAAI|nr:hypothetical protein HPB50_023308 [Hyalomma asiaticum]
MQPLHRKRDRRRLCRRRQQRTLSFVVPVGLCVGIRHTISIGASQLAAVLPFSKSAVAARWRIAPNCGTMSVLCPGLGTTMAYQRPYR